MALDRIKFNIASFNDADAGGNNYYAGIVYEIFNSNDTLADIYSDAAGANPINQDGISNKSNSSGEVVFYIDSGSYYIKVDSKTEYFDAIDSNHNAKYNPPTIQAAIDSTDWDVNGGEVFRVQEYYSGTGGGGTWKTIVAGTTAGVDLPNGTWIRQCAGVPNLVIKLQVQGDIKMSQFGAESGQDQTLAGQAALDYAESKGGGVVRMINGEVVISNVTSSHPNAAWLVPANTTLAGGGVGVTTVTRPSAERGVDGVLIANKYYDTNGGYTAAGNIIFDSFTINDGADTPNRLLGDLFGLAHADGVTFRNIKGLNHDLHLFDIAACNNVTIEPSCSGNSVVQDISASTVQIDGTSSLGVWGAFIDNTACKNIKVFGKYINTGAKKTIEIGHADNIDYESILIDCETDGAYVNDSACVAIDDTKNAINITGLTVKGKHKCNNANSIAVKLLNSVDIGKKIDDVNIDVRVSGIGRGGVLVGTGTAGNPNTWGTVRSRVIARMIPTYAGASTEIFGVQYTNIDNLFMSPDDDVSVSKASMAGVSILAAALLQDVKGDSEGGRYSMNMNAGGANKRVNCIAIRHFFSVLRDFDFKINKPRVEALSGVGHHIFGEDEFGGALAVGDDDIKVSGTEFVGASTISNIHEAVTMSDGTNGYHQVPLTGSFEPLAISSGQYTTGQSIGFKKTGAHASQPKFDMQYAVTSFKTNAEKLQSAHISATEWAGTQLADINTNVGSFSVRTGVSGVSVIINNTTFQPVIRTSGLLKVFCGI